MTEVAAEVVLAESGKSRKTVKTMMILSQRRLLGDTFRRIRPSSPHTRPARAPRNMIIEVMSSR